MKKTTAQIGLQGEHLASEYLTRNGFTIRGRNWRHGKYELDLVVERDGVLHIVEVKTRVAGNPTTPEEAFTRSKFRALCRAAEKYIELYGIRYEVQFDLIAVEHDLSGGMTLRYIPNVMSPVW